MPQVRRILVPVDFSECSRAAVSYASELAERFDARVDLLHVWIAPAYIPPEATLGLTGSSAQTVSQFAHTHATDQLRQFAEGIPGGRIAERFVEMGDPARVIVDVARDHSHDLIVIGTHGRTGLSRLMLGSVAEKVVRYAACPVLTVRGTD
jgi:universal stress protein A